LPWNVELSIVHDESRLLVETRTLTAGLDVSAVGLGCMGMSGATIDDRSATAAIHAALELGITLFDTADVYGPFSNEALLGRVLAPRRDSVLIATKFGNVRSSTGEQLGANGRAAYVRRSCDLSLQRLGTDHIDLYFQHRSDPDTPIEETVGAMAELVAAGKIRHLGLSRASAETIRRAHAVHPIAAVQSEWSLWTRDVEVDVVPTCRELGIGFVPYSPLGRGADLDSPELTRIAGDHGGSVGQLALAWLLHQGPDVVPIPGSRTARHIPENVAAVELELSAEDLQCVAAAV
jgi:aryl-alcohol dehydrogenase-like predicted oxidoreductase